ncbi:SymE family type I addiction module toxin [Sessilibacter sp. MAH2]
MSFYLLLLIKAGFEIDSPVKVRVMDGCLVLTSEP